MILMISMILKKFIQYCNLLFTISVYLLQRTHFMFLTKIINKGYEANQCEICHTQFSFIKLERIHKCKRCQKFICYKCGKNKEKIIDKEGKWTQQAHRICNLCRQDFIKIHDTIQKFDMHWAKQTKMSKQWIHYLNQNKHKDYEYKHFLKLFLQNSKKFEQEIEIIDKDVMKGRTDSSVFNFSMREFFYTVQKQYDNKSCRQNIRNVLYAIAARFDKIGYCQGMSGVAAYILCFASQQTAFIIFCDLLETVYPQNFFCRSEYGTTLIGLLAQIYFLQQYFIYFLDQLKKPLILRVRGQYYSQNQLNHFQTIIQLVGTKALLSLFVGIISFSNCIFLWQELRKHRTFEVIEKAFMAIIYLNREKILQNRSYKTLEQVFERMSLDQFKEFYYDIQIDKEFKQKSIKKFYQNLAKKWSSKSDQNIRSLSKTAHLSQKQVKFLQTKFTQDKQTKIVITLQKFLILIECYYEVLKQSLANQPMLQINSYFVKKIFQNFNKDIKDGLDFRQFVCCFSVCTKSKLKDRICAIINTFKDKNHFISFDSFQKLINNLCQISPKQIEDKKQLFIQRMNRYFHKQDKISINELEILLNDDFINELSWYVKSQSENIIELTLELYDSKMKVK